MLLIATFAALVAVRYAAVLFLAALIIRPVDGCPACFGDGTLPIRSRWLRPLARHYELRWCPRCGWQAVARKLRR